MAPVTHESLSLFCRENDQDEVRRLAIDVFGEDVELSAIRNGLHLDLKGGKLTLNFLTFRRRADKFSTTRGSSYFYFKRIESSNPELKKLVLEELLKCNLIIGVVANPTFDYDQRFVDFVFRMAINLGGYVFDGTQLLDATGQVVLPS